MKLKKLLKFANIKASNLFYKEALYFDHKGKRWKLEKTKSGISVDEYKNGFLTYTDGAAKLTKKINKLYEKPLWLIRREFYLTKRGVK